MKGQDLLTALIDAGSLNKDIAAKVLEDSQVSKMPVDQIIHERGLVNEVQLSKIKSKLSGTPYKDVNPDDITPELLKLISPEAASRYKIIPLSRTKDMLVVGTLDPDDAEVRQALLELGNKLKIAIGVYLVTPSVISAVLRKSGSFKEEFQQILQAIKSVKGTDRRIVKLEPELAVATEAPIIKLVAAILKEAVEANSSDLHIEPQRSRLRVRLRLEGALQELLSLSIDLHQPIISRIKVLSNLKLDETRIPQDGRFRTIIFDREIDFRVATFPTPFGEKVALRVLDSKVGLKSLDDLGLIGRNNALIKDAITKPFGMILITGPTGSGKTTTLYAIMQILNKEEVNIVSLEDPVEYTIDGVNQSQIRPEIGYDFATGLRQILRQNPNVIMVGEIRDKETAELAVHAALTGHILLTTLHTNNSTSSIPRLIDLGVQPFLIPSALNLMAAQRLIAQLCPYCRKPDTPAPAVLEMIKREISKLSPELKAKYKEPYKTYRAEGCARCKQKGVMGRVAIFEAFKMTPELTELINVGISETKLVEEAHRQGMITLRQDGILKALDGKVSIEEVIRETEEA